MNKRELGFLVGSALLHATIVAASVARERWLCEPIAPQPIWVGGIAAAIEALERQQPTGSPSEPEPAPPETKTIEWLASVVAQKCAPLTYGNDDEANLVPHVCPARAPGTACVLSIRQEPREDSRETCDVALRCGDEEIFSGQASCRVRERAKRVGDDTAWDAFIESERAGNCNGGRTIHVDTAAGRVTFTDDNGYGGPEIAEEQLVIAITTIGIQRS